MELRFSVSLSCGMAGFSFTFNLQWMEINVIACQNNMFNKEGVCCVQRYHKKITRNGVNRLNALEYTILLLYVDILNQLKVFIFPIFRLLGFCRDNRITCKSFIASNIKSFTRDTFTIFDIGWSQSFLQYGRLDFCTLCACE